MLWIMKRTFNKKGLSNDSQIWAQNVINAQVTSIQDKDDGLDGYLDNAVW